MGNTLQARLQMYGTLFTVYDEVLDELRVIDIRHRGTYVCCAQSYKKRRGQQADTNMSLELLVWLSTEYPEMCLAM